MNPGIAEAEKILLLRVARAAIRDRLSGTHTSLPPPRGALAKRFGVFVTVHEVRGSGASIRRDLRGCIGFLKTAAPLSTAVRRAAVASAFDDPRFPPVRAEELAGLEIEISVLSPPAVVSSTADIRVGEHGLVVRRGEQAGLLLPQVAVEQRWDRETFLRQTCRKAGLPQDAWTKPGTIIETFSAVVFNDRGIDTLS